MRKREMHEFYNAKEALGDSEDKQMQVDSFVDHEKMYLLTTSIKEQIRNFQTQDSNDSKTLHRYFNYSSHLSDGEIEFLAKLGYATKFEPEDGMNGSYYTISW